LLVERLVAMGRWAAAELARQKLAHLDARLDVRRGNRFRAVPEFVTGRYRRFASHPLMPLRDLVP
jgi:hypothetical protein